MALSGVKLGILSWITLQASTSGQPLQSDWDPKAHGAFGSQYDICDHYVVISDKIMLKLLGPSNKYVRKIFQILDTPTPFRPHFQYWLSSLFLDPPGIDVLNRWPLITCGKGPSMKYVRTEGDVQKIGQFCGQTTEDADKWSKILKILLT